MYIIYKQEKGRKIAELIPFYQHFPLVTVSMTICFVAENIIYIVYRSSHIPVFLSSSY